MMLEKNFSRNGLKISLSPKIGFRKYDSDCKTVKGGDPLIFRPICYFLHQLGVYFFLAAL